VEGKGKWLGEAWVLDLGVLTSVSTSGVGGTSHQEQEREPVVLEFKGFGRGLTFVNYFNCDNFCVAN
jgi:hypothetical protein